MRRLPLLILVTVLLITMFAPVLSPHDPMLADTQVQLQPPSLHHPMGTDLLGRDVLSRVLYGGTRTLLVMLLSTILAVAAGTAWGLVLGISSWLIDNMGMMVSHAVIAIPGFLTALVVTTVLGSGIPSVCIAVGIAQIMPVALVTRIAVKSVRTSEYVQAADALGATPFWILVRHVLPNIQMILAAYWIVTASYCLLNSTALAFLGLGGEPGVPDWGVMLAEGRSAFRSAPWIGASAGMMITLVVWSLNSLAREMQRISQH